jgi:hypothetical protein
MPARWVPRGGRRPVSAWCGIDPDKLAPAVPLGGTGAFADAYNRLVGPGITGLVNSLRGLGDGMAGTADKLKDSANLYKTSDQVNTESVPRGNPIIPPPLRTRLEDCSRADFLREVTRMEITDEMDQALCVGVTRGLPRPFGDP